MVVERLMTAASTSLSAEANPSADAGDSERSPYRLHYLRHSTPVPSISTISADIP